MFLNLTFTAFLIAICHTLYIFVYKLERQEQAFLPISQYDSTHKIDKQAHYITKKESCPPAERQSQLHPSEHPSVSMQQ